MRRNIEINHQSFHRRGKVRKSGVARETLKSLLLKPNPPMEILKPVLCLSLHAETSGVFRTSSKGGGTTSKDDVTLQFRGRQRRFCLISDQNSSWGALGAEGAATNQGALSVKDAKNRVSPLKYASAHLNVNVVLNF